MVSFSHILLISSVIIKTQEVEQKSCGCLTRKTSDQLSRMQHILTYNKPVIWKLLEQKVGPDVWISGNCKPDQCTNAEGMNGLNTIWDSLSDPQICYGYDLYYDEMEVNKMPYPNYYHFRAIFGGAAYKEILNKINQEGIQLKA